MLLINVHGDCMRAKDLYIPPGYVAGVGEIAFCVTVFFFWFLHRLICSAT